MRTDDLLKIIAEKDEIIAELKTEILELKTETESSALEKAIQVIYDCRDEDGLIDYDKLSDKSNEYAEINQYLSVYLLFHDNEEDEDEED